MSKDKELAGNYDDVNAFGLDEFGEFKSEVNPVWGVVAGVGVASLTEMAVTAWVKPPTDATKTDYSKYAELIGMGVGMLAPLAMVATKKYRPAGAIGLAAVLLSSGPRVLKKMSSKSVAGVDLQPEMALHNLPGVGMFQGVDLQNEMALHNLPGVGTMNGLGLVTPEVLRMLNGGEVSEIPGLMGNGLNQAQNEMRMLNGPALSSIGGRFGSTHFNKA